MEHDEHAEEPLGPATPDDGSASSGQPVSAASSAAAGGAPSPATTTVRGPGASTATVPSGADGVRKRPEHSGTKTTYRKPAGQ